MRNRLFRIRNGCSGLAFLLFWSFQVLSNAEIVSTFDGAGADLEFRERTISGVFSESTADSASQNTRTSSGGDRNEVVGLKFDLSDHVLAGLSNVTLNLYAYRLDEYPRGLRLFGVMQGTVSGTGTFNTETWDESATLFGDLPGLLATDGDPYTQSLNDGALYYLGDYSIAGNQPEGTLHTFDNPLITDFIQSYQGSPYVTFLLTAQNYSTGQFRTATRESTQTATGALTGAEGDFAPFLELNVIRKPPLEGLVITNAELNADGLVISGAGGERDGLFAVLASDDIAEPVTNWPSLSTNQFDAFGRFMVTNPINPIESQSFYSLKSVAPIPTNIPGVVGFATLHAGVTGGEGGSTQTVSDAVSFIGAVRSSQPMMVFVDGLIDLDGGGTGSANINSDKTIIGLGTNAWVSGQLVISGEQNVILRNLSISNNGVPSTLDGIRVVNGAQNVWVDHCTFVDCSDGAVDITVASDYVTVSWCKFTYVNQTEHRFSNLIAASEEDAGNYRITFHNNWWSTGCDQRMPMSRYGTVHLFNNYYHAPGNLYCSNARTNAQFLSENNYYQEVNNPIYTSSNGRIKWLGNIFTNTTGTIHPGTDTLDAILSPPPYPYTLEPTVDVPNIITNGAGAGKGPFAP